METRKEGKREGRRLLGEVYSTKWYERLGYDWFTEMAGGRVWIDRRSFGREARTLACQDPIT